MSNDTLIALGANLDSAVGAPVSTLQAAIKELTVGLGQTPDVSRFFRTPAFPAGAGPDFVNGAVAFPDLDVSAPDVLALCHKIESHFARQRTSRWAARTLDLDLIAQGDQVLPREDRVRAWIDMPLSAQKTQAPEELILPHPRMQDRAFVLVPLADVAPSWRHPFLGRTVAEMCTDLPAQELAQITEI